MSSFKKLYSNKIIFPTFLLIIVTLFFFSGSVTGDEEKVFNFAVSSYLFEGNFFEWLKTPEENCIIWEKCHSSFLKHNFMWVMLYNFLILIIDYIYDFNLFLNSSIGIQIIEILFSFFNSLLFFLSIILTYLSFKKEFNKNILIATIIIFFFGTYLINFASGGYVENILFFLISLRIYFSKIEITKKNIIILSIIDALLIAFRFFSFWIIIFFWIVFFGKIKNKKILLSYFFTLITLLLVYIGLNNQIDANSYLNTDELKQISFFEYYYTKISRSFCASNLYEILTIFSNRIFKSIFSFSVGVIFTFPVILLGIFTNNKKIFLIKIIFLCGYIAAYSLEQNFYLPAGIAGSRGIAPYLLIFFPDVATSLNMIVKRNKLLITVFSSFILILFSMSLNYRNTLLHYTIFTKLNINSPDSNVLKTSNIPPKCYSKENFSHFNIRMQPGVIAWNTFFINLKENKNIIIHNQNGSKKLESSQIVPNTLPFRLKFLTMYDYQPYSKYLKKYQNQISHLNFYINLYFVVGFLVQIIIPILIFNILLYRKKIT